MVGLEAQRVADRTEGDDVTYAAEVAADSPVAWWKLNETSGTNAEDDGSGTDADGTYTGGFTLDEPGIDGADAGGGSSVRFDGTNGYVAVGALPSKLQFASGTDFTVEAWCAFDGSLSSPGAAIVSEAFSGDGGVRYMLGTYDGSGATRKPSFGWYNGSWRLAASSTELTDGNWHHLVGTYDGGANELELWVDGTSVATLTPGGTQPGGTENLYLGRRWDTGGSQYFNGWLDEVALYSTKLSSTRIAAHFDAYNADPTVAAVTTAFAEAVAIDSSAGARVTTAFAEAVAVDSTPGARVTGAWVEAVVERDYAGWDVLIADDPSFDSGA